MSFKAREYPSMAIYIFAVLQDQIHQWPLGYVMLDQRYIHQSLLLQDQKDTLQWPVFSWEMSSSRCSHNPLYLLCFVKPERFSLVTIIFFSTPEACSLVTHYVLPNPEVFNGDTYMFLTYFKARKMSYIMFVMVSKPEECSSITFYCILLS